MTNGAFDLSPSLRRTELLLELARQHLDMEVACVSERRDDADVVTLLAGDAWGLRVGEPMRCEAAASLCAKLVLADGTEYGTLCCLGTSPDPTLDVRDARFLKMVAELVAADLQAERDQQLLRLGLTELLEGPGLRVAYQPIVDLRTGHVVGVEALARFPEPFTRPDETFAAAHRLDGDLGVQLEGVAVGRALRAMPQLAPHQFVSVNLSPVAAMRLARRYREESVDLDLSSVVLEITEHEVVQSYVDLQAELAPLREQGLRISIDDAGAGYASLHHIVELGPDFIKVDRSLIDGVAGNKARRVATTSFVLLGLELDATVIAEGVESPHDLVTLCDLGVDAAQGYLLGKPSTDEQQLTKWTRNGQLLVAR